MVLYKCIQTVYVPKTIINKECYKMGKTAKKFMVWAIIASVVFGVWSTVRTVKAEQFDSNCEQYLKRAADANTVETAKKELAKAISYAEAHNLTEGVVSVFRHQPKNDVGYWYNNMIEAYDELENLPEDATSLEKTSVLMKLRETLTDGKESGVSVTFPEGISIYPSNVLYFWWGLLSSIFCFGLWIMVLVAVLEEWD